MLIYEAINKVNGKAYVGLTSTTLEKRKAAHLRSARSGSNAYFHKAIRKYGPDNFEWYVAMVCSSKESMYKAEILFISLYEPWQIYNTSLGGEHPAYGMKHTEETKKVCGAYAKKRWEGRRCVDVWPDEAFTCGSYKEAKATYGVPKTTWYRERRNRLDTTPNLN
jgi:group I intron endonuclease